MRITEERIQAKLQEAAGEGLPVLAAGLGYIGPSTWAVRSLTLVVLLLGAAIGIFTYQSWVFVVGALVVAVGIYFLLRARVKFMAVGVSPRHFICIDITRRGEFLPPARQGLSAIQFPRIIDKDLSTFLYYVLGDGTIHKVRFQDFRRFPDNRRAAFRLKQAILEKVYDPRYDPRLEKDAPAPKAG